MEGTTKRIRVALDAMGGDHGVPEVVAGAIQAVATLPDVDVILVGDEAAISPGLQGAPDRVSVRHASQVVNMDEAPAAAVRSRPDNSMSVGLRLVKAGEADAFVTTGNTGAALAAALFELGRIRGVRRPALATLLPALEGQPLLLDVGANADCRPQDLVQFALMGTVYSSRVLGVASPRVGLISNGEEETKGNELVKEAHSLLKASGLRFVGNVEGKDLFTGMADVVVTDGFTGNVLIKTAEGVAMMIISLMRREAKASLRGQLGGLLLKPALRRALSGLDADEVGGAPLLGVNGVVLVGHGRSKRTAVVSLVRAGAEAARQGVVGAIAEGLGALQGAQEVALEGPQ
ncbi:MAG: phosphate acyltransferase PlsX [Anaerolineae bacterium]